MTPLAQLAAEARASNDYLIDVPPPAVARLLAACAAHDCGTGELVEALSVAMSALTGAAATHGEPCNYGDCNVATICADALKQGRAVLAKHGGAAP